MFVALLEVDASKIPNKEVCINLVPMACLWLADDVNTRVFLEMRVGGWQNALLGSRTCEFQGIWGEKPAIIM